PRNPRTGVFTRPVVALMLAGGIWSTIINVSLFVWALNSERGLREAMTMAFVSLVLVQFFKAYNLRSDRTSVFVRPFSNRWLNLAIVWEVTLLLLVIYVPALQGPFATYALTLTDWVIILCVAVTISPVLELVKWFNRRAAGVPQGR
ncbi:MAG: cation transporting ATPase C-terminal domain-containing protein, partial [Actinomycetes bacterium]|nr:cation transporting ATPase C-terminal domain-containing protein [Actinomycetes bacterium]MDX5400321.1 cation transporting ATPase C-terminal domain-containing protein [Actinomycetes bacterium]MDX5450861.1 cation transporting ATPase C-terminal domain-containing protein [Actinomycetes bacterium]